MPIKSLPIPPQLIIPVRQHIGKDATLIVVVGDKVFKGQPLSSMVSGQRSAIIHASTSGRVSAIKEHPLPHASGMSGLCVFIDTDGLDDFKSPSGNESHFDASNDASNQILTTERMLQRIEAAGIVGLGGAAFPSAVKLSGTQQQGIDTLIINAAECEPYISCDDRLMRESANEVVAGIALLIQLLRAKRCLIGIEDNKPEAKATLNEALAALSKDQPDKHDSIIIQTVPTQYPSGDARQLTRILTGVEIPKSTHSVASGILCHNVATAHAVYEAVVLNKPLLSRVVTITGNGVAQPQNVQALIGTPISFIIEQLGGYTQKAERMIMGGPMMGFPLSTDELPIIKASNCILVGSLAELTLASTTTVPDSKQAMPCIRCNKCSQVCPVNLLPQQLYWHTRAHDFDKAQEHKLSDCIECGACSYVCPSYIPLVDYFRFAKTEIKSQQQAALKSAKSRERFEFNELRKVRIKQERDEKRRAHKEALMKKKAEEAAAKAALPEGAKLETDKVGLEKTSKQDAIKAAMERAKAKKAAMKAAQSKDNNSDAI